MSRKSRRRKKLRMKAKANKMTETTHKTYTDNDTYREWCNKHQRYDYCWATNEGSEDNNFRSTSTTRYANDLCNHSGVKRVCNIGQSTIFAGSEAAIRYKAHSFDLLLSLTGVDVGSTVTMNTSAQSMFPIDQYAGLYTDNKPTIFIDWFDGDSPDVGKAFWAALVDKLKASRIKLAVYCFAGHGRTGTALASLIHLSGVWANSEDIVFDLRQIYCKKAVETTRQITYLEKVIGLKTYQSPSTSNQWGLFGDNKTTYQTPDEVKREAKQKNELESAVIFNEQGIPIQWCSLHNRHDTCHFKDDKKEVASWDTYENVEDEVLERHWCNNHQQMDYCWYAVDDTATDSKDEETDNRCPLCLEVDCRCDQFLGKEYNDGSLKRG